MKFLLNSFNLNFKMISMKRLLFMLLFIFALFTAKPQTLSLEECQDLARTNFPLAKQAGLIDQTTKATIEALMAQYFPQFRLNGQASYQSDVTKIDLQMPDGFPKIKQFCQQSLFIG